MPPPKRRRVRPRPLGEPERRGYRKRAADRRAPAHDTTEMYKRAVVGPSAAVIGLRLFRPANIWAGTRSTRDVTTQPTPRRHALQDVLPSSKLVSGELPFLAPCGEACGEGECLSQMSSLVGRTLLHGVPAGRTATQIVSREDVRPRSVKACMLASILLLHKAYIHTSVFPVTHAAACSDACPAAAAQKGRDQQASPRRSATQARCEYRPS